MNVALANQRYVEKDIIITGLPENQQIEVLVNAFCNKFEISLTSINNFYKIKRTFGDGMKILKLLSFW
jgi:hypothetical protein